MYLKYCTALTAGSYKILLFTISSCSSDRNCGSLTFMHRWLIRGDLWLAIQVYIHSFYLSDGMTAKRIKC